MNTTVQYDIRSDKLRREMEKVLARSPHAGAAFNFRTELASKPKPKPVARKLAKAPKRAAAANKD